ncbi:hypothetical protein NHX12_023639 [Muraenolepis orangiensis]|uniref:Uncharacterized protein n=1 Tax=Muraenolepis orangiensis TaxID=630683 RepID=A0A9Q0EMH6_9TELE|nr:hypothetical protein NHX12_023639 [Muraenolepis orangiensis]
MRATPTDAELVQQARRARKLWEDRLGLDDFTLHLGLPHTDTLSQIHKLFDKVVFAALWSGSPTLSGGACVTPPAPAPMAGPVAARSKNDRRRL